MAIYNNGFPMGYQQYYPIQQNYNPPAQQTNPSGSLIWVQGEAGAKSYLVAPNNTVQLWDSEKNTIYLKSADASGMPSMKILDYTIRENQPVTAPAVAQDVAYATKADVEALYNQISGIRAELDGMTKPKKEAKKDEH